MEVVYVTCFIVNIFITMLCCSFCAAMPIITRKDFLFGIRIPASEQSSPQSLALKKSYVMIVISGSLTIILLEILQFIFWKEGTIISAMYFPLLIVAVQIIAYVPNWKRAKSLKRENGWEVTVINYAETESSISRGKLSAVPWGWHIATAIVIFLCIMIGFIMYPQMPDLIPMHFNSSMEPDSWMEKSIWTIMVLPLTMTCLTLMMVGVAIIFERTKLHVSLENPVYSFLQHKEYRKRIGHTVGFANLGLTIACSLLLMMTFFPEFTLSLPIFLTIIIVPFIPLIVVGIISGQGGCKIKLEMNSTDEVDIKTQIVTKARNDDEHWVLGMFYHNPDDPSLIVEDRFGNNIGFNYSHPVAKVITIITILAIIALYVFITIILLK